MFLPRRRLGWESQLTRLKALIPYHQCASFFHFNSLVIVLHKDFDIRLRDFSGGDPFHLLFSSRAKKQMKAICRCCKVSSPAMKSFEFEEENLVFTYHIGCSQFAHCSLTLHSESVGYGPNGPAARSPNPTPMNYWFKGCEATWIQ